MTKQSKQPDHVLPPFDNDAEEAVIAACILTPDKYYECADIVSAEDFYSGTNQAVWQSLAEMHKVNTPVDMVTLLTHLRATKRYDTITGAAMQPASAAITDMLGRVHAVKAPREYSRTVRDLALARKLLKQTRDVEDKILTGTVTDWSKFADEAANMFHGLTANRADDTLCTAKDALIEYVTQLRDTAAGVIRQPWPFEPLNRHTYGIHKGELTIVAARPGVGKSAFALQVAMDTAFKDKTCLFFSLEMPRTGLIERAISLHGNIPTNALRSRVLTSDQWTRIADSSDKIARTRLLIDDRAGINMAQIFAKCNRVRRESDRLGKPLALVVIDYLQLLSPPPDHLRADRRVQVDQNAQMLKELAKNLQCPVMALAQLNRSAEQDDGPPRLYHLRESGNIEQAADNIFFLYQPEKCDHNSTEQPVRLHIGKQRQGANEVYVDFIMERPYTRFRVTNVDQY